MGAPGSRAAALGFLLLGLAAAPEDEPLARWHEGPVRYLLTGPEIKQFRKLAADDARREFIRAFWERRDPTPDTPDNELRDLFYRRVEEANRLFVETTKPGWKTDRGRWYIWLGPPDEVESDPVQKQGRGEERWIYRSPPTPHSEPNRILAFEQDASGEYRLSTDPSDYGLIASFATRPSIVLPSAPVAATRPPPGPTEEGILMDAGRLIRAPGESELIREIVNVTEHPGSRPFVWRCDFYRSTAGLTFVTINLGIEPWLLPAGTDFASLLPAARLESLDEPGRALDFVYANPFAPAPGDDLPGGYLVFQAGQGVPPGRYRAYLGIYDRGSGEVASRREEIVVPEFPADRISLSSLTLVWRTEPATEAEASAPFKRPYVLAGRRVVPRLAPGLRNGETFSLYFQVYGAAPAADGHVRLQVEYRFFVLEEDETRPLGEPIAPAVLNESAVGWQFPLVGWPVAAFRLQVTVTDAVAGGSASGSVDFTVDG
jgi:GWxTD domain-containing protein